MTKDEALKLALETLERYQVKRQDFERFADVITAIKEALAQPEQKYHRGDRLICLETEEYCIIHISGTDRQWVKFPDSHIGVYTNEQVAELFELLPKEPEQEPTYTSKQATNCAGCGEHKHTPLRIDSMGGYVCLTCIDKKLGSLLGEFGYEQPDQEPVVGCAECGANGNFALYCVTCAEKFVGGILKDNTSRQ